MTAMYWIGLTLLLSMAIPGFDGCSHQAGNPNHHEDPLSLEEPGEVEEGKTVNLKLNCQSFDLGWISSGNFLLFAHRRPLTSSIPDNINFTR